MDKGELVTKTQSGLDGDAAGQYKVKDIALREWTWRVGKEGATHRRAFYSWLNRAWGASIVGLAFVLAGGINKLPALVGIGIAFLVIWLILDIRAWVELARMRISISRALGIPINMRSNPPPPRGVEKYREWCSRNGLEPYPFREDEAKN